jgi:predicted nuclease of predicted toxin-antitoxin system
MKILIDMNLSPDWVQVFEKYGIESVHWSTIGDPRAIDRVIMNWASTNSYIVFTNDLDFGTLLAATQAESPSVIQVRTQDLLPASIENLVIEALNRFESELESGALITIDLTRSRVRILPINPPTKG